ncbi:arp2/3 complex 16 kD subunit, putative [Ixodes scapularis]|uniref:Actin-related protein 2/3 complex subunit 5 n=1 Tax=Ixodes scapularis TaxID=6945 RepID=B7PCP7_IXOSC|nr:arp2/3 complex 16 kD subunit, putative [Ixodes scapularis]|eukprot:XP_002410106.1 arp2/3 complex 16 kD subunit, putative [Ixodes scapularis]
MAKNTSSSAFRKIDIDQYNEDNYKEDEAPDAQSNAQAGPDEQEVLDALTCVCKGKNVDALKIILKAAPIGSKCQSVKDATSALVMRVLLAVKASEIEKAVGSLDRDSVDVLMKYIYRGFESPSEGSSGHLLAWHEKAYAAGGVGSIVRVMTDRKRV